MPHRGQELRGSHHPNGRPLLCCPHRPCELQVGAQEEITSVVLGAPEVESIEELVPLIARTPLVGAGDPLQLGKTFVVYRPQEIILCVPPALRSAIKHAAVRHGRLHDLAVGSIEVARVAVQVGNPGNLDLRFDCYHERHEASGG